MTDSKVTKWRTWIDGQIQTEVLRSHLYRDTWRELVTVLDANPALPPSYFWQYLRETYEQTQAVAVRRHADRGRDAVSLGRLLHEMSEHPARVTRADFLALWDREDDGWAGRLFDEWAGVGGEHLLEEVPQADLEALQDVAARVRRYVDRHLAHTDHRPIPADALPTLDEVHDAIEVVGQLFSKYQGILLATDFASLTPILDHDLRRAFRQPWIPASPIEGGEFPPVPPRNDAG